MNVKRRSGRCCGRRGPCGNDFVAIATIATSLISEYLLFAKQAVWVLKSKVFGQESTEVK